MGTVTTAKAAPADFTALLDKFPDLRAAATAMGKPFSTMRSWRDRNSVPAKHWADLVDVARRLSVRGISNASLQAASRVSATRPDRRQSRPDEAMRAA